MAGRTRRGSARHGTRIVNGQMCRASDADLVRFLAEAPLAWVLPRVQEAAFLRHRLLPRPLLDVGCGDGLFATLAGCLAGAVGVDRDHREGHRAGGRGIYRAVVTADAAQLPFQSQTFASVVSVSVLEHVLHLDSILAEIRRVLRPQGRLLVTVPGPDLGRHLIWARLLAGAGWASGATRVEDFFDRLFQHRNLLAADQWQARLRSHGFGAVEVTPFLPPRAARLLSMAYPLAVPTWLRRRWSGRWVARSGLRRVLLRPVMRVASRALRPAADGTCFLVEASRPEHDDGPPPA